MASTWYLQGKITWAPIGISTSAEFVALISLPEAWDKLVEKKVDFSHLTGNDFENIPRYKKHEKSTEKQQKADTKMELFNPGVHSRTSGARKTRKYTAPMLWRAGSSRIYGHKNWKTDDKSAKYNQSIFSFHDFHLDSVDFNYVSPLKFHEIS